MPRHTDTLLAAQHPVKTLYVGVSFILAVTVEVGSLHTFRLVIKSHLQWDRSLHTLS